MHEFHQERMSSFSLGFTWSTKLAKGKYETARSMGLALYMFKRANRLFLSLRPGHAVKGGLGLLGNDRRNDVPGFYDWPMSKKSI